MRFQTPLVPATLLKRYKRFLADIRLEDGREVTAHCPNPGSMMGLKEPGLRIWVEPNEDPRKKLKYGWRLAEQPGGHWVGIDTSLPNKVVSEALAAGAIAELARYPQIAPEVKYGQNSRVDFLLSGGGLPEAYVEVKNVTLRRDGDWAEFPDSVTARGAKHLDELSQMVRDGKRAVMLYLLQRTDCRRLKMAADLDPGYAAAFDAARAAGVEMICYGTDIGPEGVEIDQSIPVDTRPQI
ncbi:DNA/RNA nuclease SfsA [Roseobacter sp. HKCCD9010]|uniref:DNA/RNA nuclease SfsA n=1 Tax=unclassified Roseobacter TaxID=196798 RepID=UPI0014909CE4|nr:MULTISPECIES: DNA/RNA nuclease SfsA [unclassified Roseobacter]MBF9051169.1 DNA/RNA nuclease SfsA [Rhodobacterales bacterium HKCCD4356]NNV12938.1 DNA/RNA nuclease SfsA [Roseobacter sp. HKCCD7357]NNV16883.1 DNA/RNA nuclease SfsA [Roseobacter sp. HKCCD8768]NNV26485.1 DNA/RNA nuclease SfsA [Roseobacter sp. HKCCD8192]NNV30604.1 DNA/RNA nuclease SfsA [Roseobacter sp. HKCCD9061]